MGNHMRSYLQRGWRKVGESLCVYFAVYFWGHFNGTFVVVCNDFKHLHVVHTFSYMLFVQFD